MELRVLQSFVTIAELNSFSKAAVALGYSQAALTIQIHQLEQELGIHLFDRFHKSISLTMQGAVFLHHAKEILQAAENAKSAVKEKQTLKGTIRIGTIESLCSSIFPPLVKDFHKQYPDIKIMIETSSPETLLEMMKQNRIDIVYFVDRKVYHQDWIKLLEEPEEIIFVASSKHSLAKKKNILLDEILEACFILTEQAASYRYTLDQYLASINKSITPFLEIGNTAFIISLLLDNMGISFLPRFCVQKYLQNGELVELHPENFHVEVWRQMVYHKYKWVNSEMQAFLNYMKHHH